MGPGTKLPSLGHTCYDYLKQTFALQAEGLIDCGADAFLIETNQDILKAKAKAEVNGCKQAIDAIGLNCATGPEEMSEHLRHLSKQSSVAIACMPNAGLLDPARSLVPGAS